jgi:hypothetical protein
VNQTRENGIFINNARSGFVSRELASVNRDFPEKVIGTNSHRTIQNLLSSMSLRVDKVEQRAEIEIAATDFGEIFTKTIP